MLYGLIARCNPYRRKVLSDQMKRSRINTAIREATEAFRSAGWVLPPEPRWDVTDLGLGRFDEIGLVNLCEEAEYCEKLMYAHRGQVTPLHTHRRKKEDIICRSGRLAIELWAGHPETTLKGNELLTRKNGVDAAARSGDILLLEAGERATIAPGVYHAFWPGTSGCIISEVSTANDDANDNFFVDPAIGRFPTIEEDEPPIVRLVSER
jgi:D-lyxose ketol-isomerase